MNSINKLPFYKTGLTIAILNALAIINSTKYFLITAKFPVLAWLAFNVCAPSVVLFLIGFFTKRREVMAASLPFLAFFGIGGFFVFDWGGYAVIAQIGHILMAIAIVYIFAVFILEKSWKSYVYGFIAGLIVFGIMLPFQQNYVKTHPDYFIKAGGNENKEN